MFSAGCQNDFSPFPLVTRLRILGAQADRPEFCPLGDDACPENTYVDKVNIRLLTMNENGIVSDGNYSPSLLQPGFEITWSICNFSLRGSAPANPDCTDDKTSLLPENSPRVTITTALLLEKLLANTVPGVDDDAIDNGSQNIDPTDASQLWLDGETLEQPLGMAITDSDEREWGRKNLTMSLNSQDEINHNPVLHGITLDDIPVVQGAEPFAEVKAGSDLKITWDAPYEEWEYFTFKDKDGQVVKKREYMSLAFFSNGGSFNKDEAINIWMENEKENTLSWQPPLEVRPEGQIFTLVFKLSDNRGGQDWIWGKVRVINGK
jgi:hypothetical protein